MHQRMSLTGQWASEKPINPADATASDQNLDTVKGSKRTEIEEEQDFGGNPQVSSKGSEPSRVEQQAARDVSRKPDINDL